MRDYFLDQISVLPYSAEEGVQFNYIMSVIRSLLQYCSYSLVEYWQKYSSDTETDCEFVKQLLSASDGSFSSVIDKILPGVRNSLWPNCGDAWYKKTKAVAKNEEIEVDPLVNRIGEWVKFRNNRIGHGVVDRNTINENLGWLFELARDFAVGMGELIPQMVPNSDKLVLNTPDGNLNIEILKNIGNIPIVIRDIRNRGSSWRVRYQTLAIDKSIEGFYEINDLSPFIQACLINTSLYKCYDISVFDPPWRPTILLPQRQTTVFHGREDQISQLLKWYNDVDSHACLIYGEGGIGKTTIVLEFFNDLIENPSDNIRWFPDVVCYYSAKQTKWGPGGLEFIRGMSPVIEEAVRQLVIVLLERTDRTWHSGEAKQLIDKAVTIFSEAGLQRNDILLILDNTETLTRSSEDEEYLAIILRQLSSKLCRLLMTSRRYERVEARPIKVPEMDESTGEELLNRLGNIYESQPIKQAGQARLRKIVRQLSGRPLLLDIFARYSSYAGRSLDQSINLVLRDTRKDLGEFLFEDAWQRLKDPQRNVFISLGQFGNVVNGKIIGWICREFGVPHDVWLDNFDETRFGSIVDYGSEYDVHIDVSMREFLAKKFSKKPQLEQRNFTKIIHKINKQYNQYLIAQGSGITDRVVDAFKSSAAKAAKLAMKKGDYDDAILWYEEAISVDTTNAALWDRYAWSLYMIKRDLTRARECSHEAIRLDDKKADHYFTAGSIAAKQGDINEADKFLIQAEDKGKQKYLCLNQRAVARIEAAASAGNKNWRELLNDADALVKESRNVVVDHGYGNKHASYCKRLLKQANDIRLLKKQSLDIDESR